MLNSIYLYMLAHPGADLKAAFDGVRSDRAAVRALVNGLGDDRKLEMTPAEIAADDAERAAALLRARDMDKVRVR